MCPTDEGCGVTEENIFVVRPDTKLTGIGYLADLVAGDRVVVEGEPINEVVWQATHVTKKGT